MTTFRVAGLVGCIAGLVASLAAATPGPVLVPKSHLLLLDVSGSMEKEGLIRFGRYSSGAVANLVGKLLSGITYMKPEQPLLILPFSYDKDPRAVAGPFAVSEKERILAALPKITEVTGKQTDLPYALNQAITTAQQKGLPEPVVIWMLTDNKPSMDQPGREKIDPFYGQLRDKGEFRAVWFSPLTTVELGANDALVLYTIMYSRQEGEPDLEWAKDVTAQIGYDHIIFKPLYSGRGSLRFGQKTEYLDSGMEARDRLEDADNRLNLSFKEGEELNGYLRFRVRSELKGWRIEKAYLEDGHAELNVPDAYKDASEQEKLTWKIEGKRDLAVDPGTESVNLYTLNLSDLDKNLRFRTRSFFTAVWSGRLPDLVGSVQIDASLKVGPDAGIVPVMPKEMKERVAGVQNLNHIVDFMGQQADSSGDASSSTRRLRFTRALAIQVAPSKARRYAAMLLFGLPLLLLLAAVSVLRLQRDRLVLEGPSGTERIKMARWGGRHDLRSASSVSVGTLRRGLSGYCVRPEGGFTVEGSPDPRPLHMEAGRAEFTLAQSDENSVYRFALARDESAPESEEEE